MHNFVYLRNQEYACSKCGATATKSNVGAKVKTNCPGDVGDEVIRADISAIQQSFLSMDQRVLKLEEIAAIAAAAPPEGERQKTGQNARA